MARIHCNTVGYRLIFALALLLTAYLSLTPAPPRTLFLMSDLLWHGAGFFLLAMLAHGSFSTTRNALAAGAGLAGYGALLEWLQSWVPHRDPSLLDWIADIGGVILYGLLALLWSQLGSSRESA